MANDQTRVFGAVLGAAGFRTSAAPHRFLSDCCSLTLLVDEPGHVSGITWELLD